MTTYADFVGALADLSVASAVRVYDAPPASIHSVDLPALWPMLPEGEQEAQAFGASAYEHTMAADVYYAVIPVAQATPEARYAAQVGAMDDLQDALRAMDATVPYRLKWTMRADIISNGQLDYVGVVATVTATVIEG